MNKKILGILVMTLLIAPVTITTIGFENDPCNLVNNSNVNPELWHKGIEIWDGNTLIRELKIGEATDATDFGSADSYDESMYPVIDFDGWLDAGFGPLKTDYKNGPDTHKIWNLMIYSDHDTTGWIVFFGFLQDTEYNVWYIFDTSIGKKFFITDNLYQYYYDHVAGNSYYFLIHGWVNDAPNTPGQPSGPTSLKVGELGTYEMTATDPDGDSLWRRFDWGDGTISEWIGPFGSGYSVSADHSYSQEGSYSVRAQAKDHLDFESDWSTPKIVTVEEEQTGSPPETPETLEGPGIYAAMLYGEPYEYTTVTTDPDGDQISYQFFWYYEDEYSEWSTFLDSGEPCAMEHTWENPGYTQIMILRARAKDENDMYSDWNEPIEVWITGLPNAATIEGPTSGKPGIEHTYKLSATDPENDPVRFVIDWGDGTTDTETGEVPSGMFIDVGHVWQSEGTYTISVQVIDSHEAWGPVTTLSVTMPRNKPYINTPFLQLLQNFLQQHPLIYQLLQRLKI